MLREPCHLLITSDLWPTFISGKIYSQKKKAADLQLFQVQDLSLLSSSEGARTNSLYVPFCRSSISQSHAGQKRTYLIRYQILT